MYFVISLCGGGQERGATVSTATCKTKCHLGVSDLHTYSFITRQMKDNPKIAIIQGQERSSATVQKRPVRPILPACCNTSKMKQTQQQ